MGTNNGNGLITANGLGHVGSYQVSGIPFATSSVECLADETTVIEFPKVTKFVTVRCDSGSLAVGFSENGLNGSNFFTLEENESYGGDWRLIRLYLSGVDGSALATIVAGLTTIDKSVLEADIDNWSGSVGVG